MNTKEAEVKVNVLTSLAAAATDSNDALKFSQAALNVAHALATLEAVRQEQRS